MLKYVVVKFRKGEKRDTPRYIYIYIYEKYFCSWHDAK